jgi:cell division protein FtsW (lipid II flippase)
MSFEEKKAWGYLAIAVIGYAVYLVLIFTSAGASGTPLPALDYAPTMLWTIGGAIVAGILTNIAIGIVTPKGADKADQRDKEITQLGEHVGQAFIVIGGVSALLLAIFRVEYFWIANVIYLGFVLSAVLGSIARLVAYRRGFQQW